MVEDNLFFTTDLFTLKHTGKQIMTLTCRLCGSPVDYWPWQVREIDPLLLDCHCWRVHSSTESTDSTGPTITTAES